MHHQHLLDILRVLLQGILQVLLQGILQVHLQLLDIF
jgi:hypothetical protein